jgi:transcriptional regulator with XRE-family HTH domain
MPNTKIPDEIDKHVGGKVRMRRLMLDMSQEKLAGELGVTFQQVQKYEKGTNRISASRLQQIASILQVPVAVFFEGLPGGAGAATAAGADAVRDIHAFLMTPHGVAFAKALMRMDDQPVRAALLVLVELIADRSEGLGGRT